MRFTVNPAPGSKSASGEEILPTLNSLKSGLAFIILFIVASLVFYLAYTSQRDAVADFFIEWRGSQVALEGGNPYSDETTRSIQTGSRGRLAGPDEDQLAFVYPYWRVFYSAPVAFLPYQWATALWLGFIFSIYGAGLFLLVRSQGWRPSTPLKGVLFYSVMLLVFPAFSSLMLGQSALLAASLLSFCYYCLKQDRPGWAGFWLALATVKPQLTLVLIPWLLLRALIKGRRDWPFIGSFLLTLGLLAGFSFWLYPGWFGQFVAVAGRYPSYKKALTGPGFLLDWAGAAGGVLAVGLWILLLGAGLFLFYREGLAARAGAALFFDLAFCLALLLTLLLPPQTNISNPVLLALPLTLLFARWDRHGPFYGLAAVVLFGSWLLYFLLFNNFYGLLIAAWPLLLGLLLGVVYKPELKSWLAGKGPQE